MKSQKRIGYFLTIITIFFVLGCDVSTLAAPQQIPTPIPGIINTIVVQTAAAAATQTAALIPPTLTPSLTPFPTKTPTITPTPTQTVIFIFTTPTSVKPTRTKTPVPSSGGGGSGGGSGGGNSGGGGSGATWSCQWISQTPANSTHYAPGTGFNANWTVKNNGDQTWVHTTVDIVFLSGTKTAPLTRYDTTADTGVGASYVMSVPMVAPPTNGTYSMTWALQAGTTTFCSVSLTIIVP